MIKVRDIASVRFAAPDMALAERFLTDFGFRVSARDHGKVFFRCNGPSHHAYILEQGEPAFVSLGFEALSAEDLDAVSKAEGASAVTPTGEPGGGSRVILHDPDGYTVEIVHGIDKLESIPIRSPLALNYTHEKQRRNTTQRPPRGAAEMLRLGHVGLTVTSIRKTIDWYSTTLGLRVSDTVNAGPNPLMAFVRCAPPGLFSDHHALALFQAEAPEFGHAAFEVQDFDAVGIGHYHLKRGEWNHAWGVGRHTLGSQIFDYWVDPWGRMIEHFADSDIFDADQPGAEHQLQDVPVEIWGPPLPEGKGPKRERVTEGTI